MVDFRRVPPGMSPFDSPECLRTEGRFPGNQHKIPQNTRRTNGCILAHIVVKQITYMTACAHTHMHACIHAHMHALLMLHNNGIRHFYRYSHYHRLRYVMSRHVNSKPERFSLIRFPKVCILASFVLHPWRTFYV